MRWTHLVILSALLLTAPASLASQASGTSDAVELTIVALEEGCPEGVTFCYEVTHGSLEEIGPGTTVNVTFENRGEIEHELMVRTLSGVQLAPPVDTGEAMDHTEGDGPEEHANSSDHEDGNTTEHDGNQTTHDGNGTTETQGNHTADGEQAHDEGNQTGHDDGNHTAEGNQTASHGEMGDHATQETNTTSDHETDDHAGHEDHLVAPGATRTVTFTVPEDAEGVYLWCSLPGHEEAGMQDRIVFEAQGSVESGPSQTPAPGAGLVGALLAVAALLVQSSGRRR